jgi:PST family polysaccharide transporter
MAYRIMLYPIQNIASVVARVAFPALSAGRDDRPVMASDYLRMTRVTAAVTFPLMTAFAVMSRPAVAVLLGSKWAGVAPLIMVLAPVGLVQSVSSSAGVLFQSVGRTDVQFRWALATSPIFIGAFILGVRWGVMGVAVGYAVVSLVLWLPGMWLALRQAGMTVGNYLGALSRAGANSVVMGIVLGLVWLVANPSAWLIAAACVAGVVAYCGMVLADDRTSAREILRLVRVTGSR